MWFLLFVNSNEIDWETLSTELKTNLDDAKLEALPPNERLDQLMKILVDLAYKYVPAKRSICKKWSPIVINNLQGIPIPPPFFILTNFFSSMR